MLRLLILFLLTAILITPPIHAQLDSTAKKVVAKAAFELTKATVEFIATDKVKFPKLSRLTCEGCTDYNSLIKFTVDNKLQKADDLVRNARKQATTLTTPTATVGQILTELKRYLNDRATKGDNRERRIKLPTYADYTTRVTKILADADVPTADLQTQSDESTAASTETTDTGEPVVTDPLGKQIDAGGLLSLGGLALLLSLLNLGGIVYLWLLRGRVSFLEEEREKLLNRVVRLETSKVVPPVQRPIVTPELRQTEIPASPKPAPASEPQGLVQSISPAAAQLTPAPRPAESVLQTPAPMAQPPVQSQAAPSNQLRRREVVFYGRTADLGDGFSVASLLAAPDRDTVFQIDVRTDFQAIYHVTEKPEAQQLALSDPYSYLADACEYTAKPIPNAHIRTDQPGQLALQGDKWKIIQKAKISFY